DFSRDTGLAQFKEIKARLISLGSTGLVTFEGPTIDVSVSTPPLKSLGNETPTVAWSRKRNEFVIGWSKTDFSTADNFLLYQRINPFTGSMIEPTQTILTTERGRAAHLNYNSVSGNFLLGWLGAGHGNFKTFSTYKDPVPVVSQLSSTKAYAGTKIIITGLNFGKTPYVNSVMFDDVPAKIDTLFFDTKKLQVTVPPGLGRRVVPVTVTFDDQTSNGISFENISSTAVTSVAPLVGALGDTITIRGSNFPDEENLVQVTFGSIVSAPTDIISSEPTEIKVKVPQTALRGSDQVVNVVIQAVANFGVNNFRVIRPPVIESVAVDGNEFTSCKSVVISGHDLFANEDDLTIKVGDVVVSQEDIIIASDDGLNFRIPLGAEGQVPITVITDDREGISPATYKVWLGSEVNEATVNEATTVSEFKFTNRSDDHIDFKAKVYNQCSVDAMKFWTKGISASDNDWKSMDITSSLEDNLVSFPMPENAFTDDPIGLLAFYEVIDKSTKIKYSDTFRIYRNYTELDSSNVIPNLRFGGSVADYSIIALPYEFQVNKITTVFRDLFNDYGYDKSKWRISHYENSKGEHVEYPQLDEIDPGKGYWLISRYPHDIFFEGAKTLNVDNGYYPITLVNGWNQIGNPFNFNVSWADVLRHSGNPTDIETFKTFKDGTWSESGTIDRFRGGFVKYNGNGTFELKIPVTQNESINGGRVEEDNVFPGDLSKKEWRIAIDLAADQLKNKLTSFGMHPQSIEGEDERDEHRLPAFVETLDAVFSGSLSTSMVNTSDHYSWEFEVFNTTLANEVALNWDNTRFGANDRELYLHDKVEERLINMRTQNSYTFIYRPGHSFAIHFGDAEYIKGTSRPGRLTLATAYPNPMTTTTNIAFSLGRRYQDVRLSVYDLQGKEVKTILHEPLEAGFYETHWEGNDAVGTPLPNGLWIYRLQVTSGTNTESAVGKVVLRR
ncbi:MAG TPA: IPT/TIG domain-containing protein, partial [Chryseolinea sp.]